MNDSGDQQQQRVGSSVNPKIASDSGYGSNKSTQRVCMYYVDRVV
ncbi:hypothetical protein Ocin01_12951 [Orchesella cincta]|uniref:Uncharacterized protein n=1 Tax=Orchesella cincta TaxID=48709 RepID=A0A1D2MLH2_ORCCI|nr:hypothetical protein Ocin01_12951 [Orchesella cincta]